MSRIWLAAALAAALPAPATAEEQVVTQAPGAAGLTAYAGHVVWSQPDLASSRWRLMQWHAGHVSRLPVADRGVPFDADAGPDARGRPVVVYSRCRIDPPDAYYAAADWSQAAGCDVYELALGGGRPHRLAAISTRSASETTPSIWRGEIAFARRGRRESTARLLLYDLARRRTRRLPAGRKREPGSFASHGPTHAAVSQIDLGPRAVAFVWLLDDGNAPGIDAREWDVRVDSTRSGLVRDLGEGGAGECDFREPLSPNVIGREVQYLASVSGCGEQGGTPESTFVVAYDLASGDTSRATPTQFALGLARDGATTWLLRGAGAPVPGPQPAVRNPVTCAQSPTPCELVRARGLTFSPFG